MYIPTYYIVEWLLIKIGIVENLVAEQSIINNLLVKFLHLASVFLPFKTKYLTFSNVKSCPKL